MPNGLDELSGPVPVPGWNVQSLHECQHGSCRLQAVLAWAHVPYACDCPARTVSCRDICQHDKHGVVLVVSGGAAVLLARNSVSGTMSSRQIQCIRAGDMLALPRWVLVHARDGIIDHVRCASVLSWGLVPRWRRVQPDDLDESVPCWVVLSSRNIGSSCLPSRQVPDTQWRETTFRLLDMPTWVVLSTGLRERNRFDTCEALAIIPTADDEFTRFLLNWVLLPSWVHWIPSRGVPVGVLQEHHGCGRPFRLFHVPLAVLLPRCLDDASGVSSWIYVPLGVVLPDAMPSRIVREHTGPDAMHCMRPRVMGHSAPISSGAEAFIRFYCDGVAMVVPRGPCSEGYLCPSGSASATAVLCPVGNYVSNRV